MDPTRFAVLGIDAGNSKTAAACVTLDGRRVGWRRGGFSNYQTTGPGPAFATLLEVAMPLADEAAAEGLTLVGVGLGLTGMDRPRDGQVLDPLTRDLVAQLAARVPCVEPPARVLLNDACLVLRAGTDDGVGIAVSSGTGGNCVGRSRDGRRIQIGGLASELGDGGGAHDIALQGLRAAGKARDGRGWKTAFGDLVTRLLGLGAIEDILDFAIPGNHPDPDNHAPPPQISLLAPLVFEAARGGDLVAHRILTDAGRDLGACARVAATQLFAPGDTFPLVLGGSVLMNNPDSPFARAIALETQTLFPGATPCVLEHHPVLGAVLLALDEAARRPGFEALLPSLADGTMRRRVGVQVNGLF